MDFSSTEVIYIVSFSLLLLISLIVTFKRQEGDVVAAKLLMVYFWCFFYLMFFSFLFIFHYGSSVPHFFRTPFIATLLLFSTSYLYLKKVLKNIAPKWTDLVHLIPAIIYIVDFAPFFILPGSEKMLLLSKMNTADFYVVLDEGWFMPAYGHIIMRYLIASFYFILQVRLLVQAKKGAAFFKVESNPLLWKWLILLIGTQFLLFIVPMFFTIFAPVESIATGQVTVGALVSIVQCYYLSFHPQLLYGFDNNNPAKTEQANAALAHTGQIAPVVLPPSPQSGQEVDATEENGYQYYSDEMLDEVGQSLQQVMSADNPVYLRPNLKLNDLSKLTGISMHKISAYTNRRGGQGFQHYINQLRIQYCLKKIDSGELEHKTFEALAQESGFHSRSTFIRAFKIVTGDTPTSYLQQSRLRKNT